MMVEVDGPQFFRTGRVNPSIKFSIECIQDLVMSWTFKTAVLVFSLSNIWSHSVTFSQSPQVKKKKRKKFPNPNPDRNSQSN